MSRDINPLINAIRAQIVAHSPRREGLALIEATATLEALGCCMGYVIAGAPADRRAELLAAVDDYVSKTVSRIVSSGHRIVGTGVVVPRDTGGAA